MKEPEVLISNCKYMLLQDFWSPHTLSLTRALHSVLVLRIQQPTMFQNEPGFQCMQECMGQTGDQLWREVCKDAQCLLHAVTSIITLLKGPSQRITCPQRTAPWWLSFDSSPACTTTTTCTHSLVSFVRLFLRKHHSANSSSTSF